MITDNLATLFTAGQPGVRFRQGTVLTWNASTGENTVDVAGGTLTNVPIMNTGEAIALKAGHVVGLLGQGSAWFILGRVTPPNDPNFASASVAFGGAGNSADNFALSTAETAKVTSSITVPSWADEAIVLCTVNARLLNPRPAIDFATIRASINGISGGGGGSGFSPNGDASGGYVQAVSASAQRLISNPGPTITVAANIYSQGAGWVADTSNLANVDAIAVFRSIA